MSPRKNYAIFGIVEGVSGGIPLVIEKGKFAEKMWKLPGGRPIEDETSPAYTLLRELSDEINVIVSDSDSEKIFSKCMGNYDFLVYVVKYYSGEIKAGHEIEKVKNFTFSEIEKMTEKGKILKNHADALTVYINRKKMLEEIEKKFSIP